MVRAETAPASVGVDARVSKEVSLYARLLDRGLANMIYFVLDYAGDTYSTARIGREHGGLIPQEKNCCSAKDNAGKEENAR